MSIETTHVIKKTDYAAERAVRPDPSVLLSSFKIPARHVKMESETPREKVTYSLDRLVQQEDASMASEPVEVFTRRMDDVPPPTKGRNGAGKKSEGDESEPTREQIEAEWTERLEQAVEEARKQGLQEGRQSIRQEADEEIAAIRAEFAEALDGVQQAWEDHLKDARIDLVQLAFRIARIILDSPLPPDVRTISENSIRDAVDAMADGVPLEVVLHPVSYLRLQEQGVDEQLLGAGRQIRWRSDPDLKENEWVVQSSRSAVRRLEAELLDQLHRELSLRDIEIRAEPADEDDSGDRSDGASDEPASR